MSPLDKVEELYNDLVLHYGHGEKRELRAAIKLLLVALVNIEKHGGSGWHAIIDDYVDIAKYDPEKMACIVESNRADKKEESSTLIQ